MSKFDHVYHELCQKIINEGERRHNRTGIDTIGISPAILQFDLSEEFPILTTKHVAWKSAIKEMLWIYQAQSNDVRWLRDRGVKIWNEWEIGEDGTYNGKFFGEEYAHTIGTAYGWITNKYQLTQNLIEKIKTNPDDRRMIMSLWQDAHVETAALPSCVWSTTWRVLNGRLNCIVNQRSCDVALGLPFNITQYATLVNMIAKVTGYKPGTMTWVISDAHIYVNQLDGIKTQLERLEKAYPAPKLWLNPDIDDFFAFDNSNELKDIQLIDYKHHDKISMEIAI